MAGPVRQPIDLASLERYIDTNVPEIKTPLELKQVRESRYMSRHAAEGLTVHLE